MTIKKKSLRLAKTALRTTKRLCNCFLSLLLWFFIKKKFEKNFFFLERRQPRQFTYKTKNKHIILKIVKLKKNSIKHIKIFNC